MRYLSCLLASLFLATPAAADALEFVYEQELEGVYSQSWFTMHLTNTYADKHEVYVKGDGKLGDFFGVLYLDCSTPQFSRWLAVGGIVDADDVPIEVIRVIRERDCNM